MSEKGKEVLGAPEAALSVVDNGSSDVQVAVIGEVTGSDSSGNPVKQAFTEAALAKIAETHDDVLVDVDHESEREGKTAAAGWLKKLHLVPGKGLFGKVSWTDIGKKLVDNRVFRFLSPSFLIDKDSREPLVMTSVALTNKPAQNGIKPIINSAPSANADADEQPTSTYEYDEDISLMDIEKLKGELKAELKDEILAELKAAVKELASEKQAEKQAGEEAAEEKAEEQAESEEAAVKDEGKEQPDEQTDEEAEEAEEAEVIKIEALNSAPAPSLAPQPEAWRSMTPEQFCRWIDAGMPK